MGRRRAVPIVYGIGPPDHALAGGEDLADAEPAGRAQVADERLVRARIAGRGRVDAAQVRVGEVGDVDVVADARPVGRGVVVAEDRQRRRGPRRRRARSG